APLAWTMEPNWLQRRDAHNPLLRHSRESGNPGASDVRWLLGPRFRGDDERELSLPDRYPLCCGCPTPDSHCERSEAISLRKRCLQRREIAAAPCGRLAMTAVFEIARCAQFSRSRSALRGGGGRWRIRGGGRWLAR